MDYEKKYKEAERLYRTANADQRYVLEYIFPELCESKDERIRKELIEFVKSRGGFKQEYIAWLEKQGEQKPFDYENADIQQKDFAPKETVKEAESNLTPLERKVKDILFSFHINAADGISFDGTMAIVHNLITLCQQEQKPADKIKPKFKVGDKVIGIVSDMQYYITDVCYDHYYTESGCIIMFCSQDNFKLVEQKSAWSREDEKIRQTIINEFKQCSEWYCSNGLTKEDCINWLNKQEYFEWGDEDNENMNSLCVLLDQMVSINAIGNEHSIEYKNWLKSLKGRAQPQPKQEWSEEDQNALEDVREAVVHYWGGDSQDILLYWLKSIKQKLKGE